MKYTEHVKIKIMYNPFSSMFITMLTDVLG